MLIGFWRQVWFAFHTATRPIIPGSISRPQSPTAKAELALLSQEKSRVMSRSVRTMPWLSPYLWRREDQRGRVDWVPGEHKISLRPEKKFEEELYPYLRNNRAQFLRVKTLLQRKPVKKPAEILPVASEVAR